MSFLLCISTAFLLLTGCVSEQTTIKEKRVVEVAQKKDSLPMATILNVTTQGTPQNYTFSVEVSSPDTGCEQYANWWEIITEDGVLIYRRILGHSHVNEQPFLRSGGAVAISENQVVLIRAHLNTTGYGTSVFKGSVSKGFTKSVMPKNFATNLANQQPLPRNCAF